MNSLLFNIPFFSLLFLFSIWIHELGHYIYLKKVGYKHKIHYSSTEFYINIPRELPKKEKKRVLWFGIILGIIPILITSYFLPLILILLPVYIYGCRSDFKLLLQYA